jgi:hypothetical protein
MALHFCTEDLFVVLIAAARSLSRVTALTLKPGTYCAMTLKPLGYSCNFLIGNISLDSKNAVVLYNKLRIRTVHLVRSLLLVQGKVKKNANSVNIL